MIYHLIVFSLRIFEFNCRLMPKAVQPLAEKKNPSSRTHYGASIGAAEPPFRILARQSFLKENLGG